MDAKQQPIDLDAERTFLGGLMLATEVNEDELRAVSLEDFSDPRHRLIYEAILKEYDGGGKDAPSLVVTSRLRSEGSLKTAGGAEYIESIVAGQMLPKGSAARAATIISERAQLRELIAAAQGIINAAVEKEVEVSDKIDAAEASILKIRNDRERGEGMLDMIGVLKSVTQAMADGTWGNERGLNSGFAKLDDLLGGFQPGHFVVLGARPGIGKTSLALTLAANVARLNDCGVGVFSLEMPSNELVERLLASMARVNILSLKKDPPNFKNDSGRFFDVMQRIGDAVSAMDNLSMHVDDTPALSLADVRHRARRLKTQVEQQSQGRRRLGVIVIDYLQLMRAGASANKNRSREQEVASISNGLKGLAKELKITILALSQLRRQVEQEGAVGDDGKAKGDRQPRLSDLRESGAIEQDADSVMVLHKRASSDDDEADVGDGSTIDLIVLKNRHGSQGAVSLSFHKEYTLFTPKAEPRHGEAEFHGA